MTDTILILTEDALNQSDVDHILSLHEGEELAYRVMIPADSERPLLSAIIDFLSVGELRKAWEEVTDADVHDKEEARETADERLHRTVATLREAGLTATGIVTEDDPLPAVTKAVAAGEVREIVVVTYPHMMEDTFHRDWASRAREALRVPVLHLYSGTSELG